MAGGLVDVEGAGFVEVAAVEGVGGDGPGGDFGGGWQEFGRGLVVGHGKHGVGFGVALGGVGVEGVETTVCAVDDV